jgi:hypothetical protein
MQRRLDLVTVDVSEEHVASILKAERIHGLGTTLAIHLRSWILSTLKMEATNSSESSVITGPHNAASQKTAFYIVTSMKTS